MKNWSWRQKIRWGLWSGLVLLALILVWLAIVPGGRLTYVFHQSGHNWLGGKGFIGSFTPADRVVSTSTDLKIMGDPVYFSLFTPRRFESAKMTIVYRGFDYESYPIIEAGVMVDPVLRNYRLSPVSNFIIDRLAQQWPSRSDNGLLLLQKEEKYKSVSELLANPPQLDELAFYNYQYNFPFKLEGYKVESNIKNLPDLRGSYQFYSYIDAEPLNFSVDFLDLNQNADQNGDPVKIYVYNSLGQAVAEYDLADDGIKEDNGKLNPSRNININLDNLTAGVYKVEVKTNDDLVSQNIKSTQSHLAFISRLWLYNRPAKGINVWTNGSFLKVKAADPAGVGVISLNNEDFYIDETYEQYLWPFAQNQEINEVSVSGSDVVVETSGTFSFSEAALFNPDVKKVDSQLDLSRIKYIIADYTPPVSLGIWRQATVEMDLTDVYRQKGKSNFMISIPGLLAENGLTGAEIKSLRLELTGKSLIQKLKEYVK